MALLLTQPFRPVSLDPQGAILTGAAGCATKGEGTTPVMRAARVADAAAVGLLLEAGADPNAANNNGETPPHVAAAKGSDDLVRMLVQKGAKPDVRDKSGRAPLDVAFGAPGSARGAGAEGTAVRESTAALLKRLMDASSAVEGNR